MKKTLIIGSIILFTVLFFLYRTFFASEIIIMSGASMNPTYIAGDSLLTDKNISLISRGTIIDFSYSAPNGEVELIKRVVGLPKEKVEIKDGRIYINDRLTEISPIPLVVDWAAPNTKNPVSNTSAVLLGDNQYFVLGDNPSQSMDSRNFGPINKSQIISIVTGKY